MTTPEQFQQMLERDIALGTPLTLGEDTSMRYSGIEGIQTGVVSEYGIIPTTNEYSEVPPQIPGGLNMEDISGVGPLSMSIFGWDVPDWLAPALSGLATGLGITEIWNALTGTGGTSTEVTNINGGTDMSGALDIYNIGGPGVPEPATGVLKQWKTKAFAHDVGEYWVYYFKMIDGYTLCYNARKKSWKRWKPRKNIVLSSNPRLSTVRRAERAVFGTLKKLAKKSDYLAVQKRR